MKKYIKDDSGHEHAPAGSATGGQFTGGGGGGSSSEEGDKTPKKEDTTPKGDKTPLNEDKKPKKLNDIKKLNETDALKGYKKARDLEQESGYWVRNPDLEKTGWAKDKTDQEIKDIFDETTEDMTSYKNRYKELISGNTTAKEKLEGLNVGNLYSSLGSVAQKNIDEHLASINMVSQKNGSSKEGLVGLEIKIPKSSLGLDKLYTTEYSTQGMKEGTDSKSHTIAHEIGHVIDFGYKFSSTPEWKKIYNEEIKGDKKNWKLSWYADKDNKEGFCEFGRYLLNGNDTSMYPQAEQFWKDNNLMENNKENYSYICHKGIAIFDEDETYDKFKLETICKANNDRIEDTDEEIPIILGHTIDGAQETLQPPRVGYANNFHLIQIGKNKPRWAVASDFYLDDKYDLTEYKERSVELWTEDMIIHPIALLKTSRPAKNLGVLNFKIENKDKLRKYFKEEDEELEMQKDDILNLIVETLNNSDIAAAVKKIMETQAAQSQTTAEKLIDDPLEEGVVPDGESLETPIEGEQTAEGDEEAVVEGEENDEEEIAAVEEIEQEHDAGKAEETVNAIEETEKNEATPSGTNTFVPSIEEDEDEKKKIKKMSMALESQTAIASKYAEQFKQAVEDRNNIANKLVVSERTNELLKLSYEYGFNVPEELNLCLNMDAPQFEQHKVIIKSRYNKVPLDRAVINPVKEVDDNRISQEKVLEIVKYATKNNITFEQARKEIK